MADHVVKISSFAFDPASLEVIVGDTVAWENKDTSVHTATRLNEPFPFDTGNLVTNQISEPISFDDESGEDGFEYICSPHPFMIAKVIVKAGE